MDRRTYLGAIGSAGITTTAGCLDLIPGTGNTDTALPPPTSPRGDPIHPIHGEEFPRFRLPDPIDDTEIDSADLEGEWAFLLTFVYTSCTQECGTLLRLLQLIQADAMEQGYTDDVALLAMTFDPETDDENVLREYAHQFDVDLDEGNFHFLRPASNDRALELLNERFGVPVEFDDEHDHDEHEIGHGEHGHGLHYYMLFLVNESGIVERSYPNVVDNREETRPKAIIEDVRAVVK